MLSIVNYDFVCRYHTPRRRVVVGYISWKIAAMGFYETLNTKKYKEDDFLIEDEFREFKDYIKTFIPSRGWRACNLITSALLRYPR